MLAILNAEYIEYELHQYWSLAHTKVKSMGECHKYTNIVTKDHKSFISEHFYLFFF